MVFPYPFERYICRFLNKDGMRWCKVFDVSLIVYSTKAAGQRRDFSFTRGE